jgi:hypothetical protein
MHFSKGGAMNLRKLSVLLLVFCFCCAIRAEDATKSAVQQAVNAELAADRSDHTHWIFHEVDRKPRITVEQWVAQTAMGDVTRVVKRNGRAISSEQQRSKVEAFIHDSSAQSNQRQGNVHDDRQAEALLKLLPVAFVWTQTIRNQQTTTYHFKPDPKFQPPSREARVFAAMEGNMTVDNGQHRIEELKGRLIRDVNFGWGFLGKLRAGGSFEVDRTQVGPGIWDITATHVHIVGHALLFKSISEVEDDVKTSWQREPDGVTLEQAAAAVMKK